MYFASSLLLAEAIKARSGWKILAVMLFSQLVIEVESDTFVVQRYVLGRGGSFPRFHHAVTHPLAESRAARIIRFATAESVGQAATTRASSASVSATDINCLQPFSTVSVTTIGTTTLKTPAFSRCFRRSTEPKGPTELSSNWDDATQAVFDDASEDEASWLDTSELMPSVPYRDGVVSANEAATRERFASHAQQLGIEPSMVGVGEGFDGTEWQDSEARLEWRFVEHAAAGRLLMNCLDAKAIQAYRWWFRVDTSHGMSSGFEDEINLIREGYLAGVRYWIERILAKRIPFRSGDDFAAFDRLSRAVLEIVREAYTREAPSTLLGEDERFVLRLAYPLMSNSPAESWIDDDELRQKWNGSDGDEFRACGVDINHWIASSPQPHSEQIRRNEWSFDEFADDWRFFERSLCAKVLSHFHHVMPGKVDTDFQCRRVGIAFVNWIAVESRRGGIEADFPAVSAIKNEQTALSIVTSAAVYCAASPQLSFGTQTVEMGSAREQEHRVSQSDLPTPNYAGNNTRHSPDFASVIWFGEQFTFTMNQAACVKVLWEAWENKTPILGAAAILEAADISQSRLDLVFRGHPAWRTMIVSPSKGRYCLKTPTADE